MSEITIVFAIIAVAVILFITNRLPVVFVAMCVPFALYMTGVLSLPEALSGFGDPTVIFVATLFIVSSALEAAGVTAWAGQKLIDWTGGGNRLKMMTVMLLMIAVLTAMISVNGAVAAMMPVVVVLAIRTNTAPSQLMMPLAFGAHTGSQLALSGTPISVLTNDALVDAGAKPFAFFEFAYVGIPLVLGGIAVMYLLGPKLLPFRQGPSLPEDLSQHARTLSEQYRLAGNYFQLRVRPASPLIGLPFTLLEFGADSDCRLLAATDAAGQPLEADTLITAATTMVVAGTADAVAALAHRKGLAVVADDARQGIGDALLNRNSGLAEIIIPPRSRFVDETLFPGMATPSGDLVVLAIQRGEEQLGPGGVKLKAGDTLLLQGSWAALEEHLADPAVLMVDSPAVVRRQAVPLGLGAKAAILILLAMVAMLAFDLVQPAIAGMISAGAVVMTGLLRIEECYRAINWTTIILMGAMMPLSAAMFQTGAAQLLADVLIRYVGDFGPTMLLVGLFAISAVLGQVISNTATALIVLPVAVMAAHTLHLNPTPVLMSVNVACAAAFLTPIATPVNLMVMGPAGYQFADYWKLGGVMMLMFFVVAVFWVPVVWPF